MSHRTMLAGVAVLLLPALLAAQSNRASPQAKIRDAMTAAPASIAAKATIMDWPASPGAQPMELRKGSNGWVCFPDMPDTKWYDPMCLDDQWLKWAEAWQNKTPPQIDRIGIGYMVSSSGEGSNTDPYATARTPDNEWGVDPPHIMLLVPDPSMLEGMTTDRNNGGPWVMWKGTPYVHIMVPVDKPARK